MKINNDVREAIMKMKPEDQPIIHKDHKMRTRRDFLKTGLVAGGAYALAPSLLSVLKMDVAMAQDAMPCEQEEASSNKIPVLIIDLAGGANFAGSNYLVGTEDGQHSFLNNYRVMGLPDELNPLNNANLVDSTFGLKMHANSGVLEGMIAATAGNPGLRQNVDGAFFCAQSENDRSTNPLSPLFWLAKAGATGELSATAGSSGGQAGARSVAPQQSFDPTISPVRLNNPGSLTGLIDLGAIQQQFGNAGVDKAQKTLKAIERLSAKKIEEFSSKTMSDQLKTVAACGFDTSRYTSGGLTQAGVNPQNDPQITAVYNGQGGNPNAGSTEATIVKAVTDGLVGVGAFQMGGYDYHGRTRLDQDTRDFNVGRVIGRALSVAAAKNTPLMIYIISDGSVAAQTNLQAGRNGVQKYQYRSDNSARAGVASFLYSPNINNQNTSHLASGGNTATAKRQVGSFQDSNAPAVNRNDGSLIQATAQNVQGNVAACMTLNYLAAIGEESRFLDVVGANYQGFVDNMSFYKIWNKVTA